MGIFRQRARAVALVLAAALALPGAVAAEVPAASAAGAARLSDLLGIGDLLAVMAQEGRDQGADLRDSMFGGRQAPGFEARLAELYDPARMEARFAPAFAGALAADPAAAAAAEAFFATPLGRKVAGLELEARRSLLDPDLREAAEVAAEKMQGARDSRLRLIRRLIETADLVEQNTAGTMTALAAFNLGLNETEPPALRQPEADVLADIWAGEAGVRAETTDWLVTFMVLAYAPLSDAELKEYTAFQASAAGLTLNRALFAGVEAVMRPALADLGREVGRILQGRDI